MRTIALVLVVYALPVPQRTLDDFFRDFTTQWMHANPNLAASTRYFTGAEQDLLERQIAPVTTARRRERIRLARQGLAELAKFDRAQMTDNQRVSSDVMRWLLDSVVREEPYLDYAFPFEQFNGVNVGLPNTLTVVHPLLNEKDAVNYVARLGQVSARIEEAITESRRLSDKGMIPPRFIVRSTITQMKDFIAPPPAQNPFVTAFVERASRANSISSSKREELRAEAEKIVAAQVYPAWQKAIGLLQSLESRATDDAGIWRFKDGAEAYSYNLRRFTTTSLSADEIHQIGLREVARLEKEMDTILRRLGRTQGSVNDRIARLRDDLKYPNTEDGRKVIMADVEGMLRDAEKRAAILFDRRPKAPIVAQPFPRFREVNAAANYTAPAPDGSRPGVFQIPLRIERMTKFGLRSLVYHETVPGHHFQIALELENTTVPRFRQIRAFGGISALSEGWGLYAERLAAESGWYEGDLEGLLGQLDSELFRARRLVVDTGIHAKHWTRQQAIDYGIEASEIERYVVNPGQACSYMIGELKIIELREKAKKALGNRFSLQEYHNAILSAGTVPLELVEKEVDRYIAKKNGN
ncbi:MAG TPA: DUF885 domain-containing protein [Terriglobia bacterium]|nr:DUF885 domain-containing protein [Terriglobia bacterium]